MDIFLDCDGVLADFVNATIISHNRQETLNDITHWSYFDDWDMTAEEFWEGIRGREFWTGIKPFPWTKVFYDELKQLGTVRVATASADDPECPSGKALWLGKHLGIKPSKFITITEKHLLARSNSLLIDDNEKNVALFRERGGHAILFPQPWNSGLGDWRTVLETAHDLKKIIG